MSVEITFRLYYSEIVSKTDRGENMTLREIRLENKQRVVKTALDYFVEKGIERSRVSDIAKDSGLTERSVFRYFENKPALVLDALLYLWNSRITEMSNYFRDLEINDLTGKERCLKILLAYGSLFMPSKKELIFVEEAEVYLYRMNLQDKIKFDPLKPYVDGEGPLQKAIKKGIADGSIRDCEELEYFYNNCFDTLLGLLQKLASGTYDIDDNYQRKRIESLCKMLVNSIANE